ncbi:Arc family DNA-binding protein [uncultured Sphaerochaeta sp.]|uniref:Arc family DNA-binding protein n=1 Tax=uncultured Sphaerochaeta sp. TaxID=886478 RepID=UPI002A0A460D|nr:Arc family DNA-binding protein [uncultured Sphaerochaeta sp.]
MEENKEKGKKQLLLRLSPSLWKELAQWAEDDFRSINGQIEFLLTENVRKRKKDSFLEDPSDSSE